MKGERWRLHNLTSVKRETAQAVRVTANELKSSREPAFRPLRVSDSDQSRAGS